MKTLVKVDKINKSYGKKQVLHDVSFEIDEGEILGFIGPNGAGKTTTIKLMTGLQKIDSGEVYINGFNIQTDFEKAIERVGGIIESPDNYQYLSGYDNLMMYARLYPDVTKKRIDELIEISGLKNRLKDKVSTYSLGMKQRLGIAIALVNNPNVLILDEPTNGLDPEGIKELRDLIKKLSKKGIAIFISSHNLSELESFITNACIIQNGKIVKTASIDELKKMSESFYVIEVDDAKKAMKVLDDEIELIDKNTISVKVSKKDVAMVIKKLVKNDIRVYSSVPQQKTLEEAFLDTTGGNEID
jgi:ABC-2 type transport system ATP-binding protein